MNTSPDLSSPTTRPGVLARVGRLLRGLVGSLAVGLVLLALVLVGAQAMALGDGEAGPGWLVVTGHVLGAAAAVALQRQVDRGRGARAWAAGLGVLVVVALVLWYGWYR
ncbi:hypothetical protein [Streptoalloteichus tenebrarius]|uniref:hypothetical protein n=1 Tax=Streptoalloteichus tenebrarius (strain ATCC 17920 / DSM 40477 / JCM 4838 / CBS 697.72 / NBRC 16177 / NCIMB 11028 / NRRL B-12390 / A12253. 1 / ISP 5477) TaxID=1933 RepID=UPI0020A48208|nr:hypothetical protein [Streptoalloteichus tenebrarius]